MGRKETPAPAKLPKSESRLDSWKDIAAYLKRSVSTVQRWEKQEGLPVHRLPHSKLGSLYAYPSELDAWWNVSDGSAAATGAGATEPRSQSSILVLPFANMSREPDEDYFADGLTEELIADLSRVHALRVISRTSAMRLKGTHEDLTAIARRLNVHYVLEGSVRRAGNDLRITAQLIDASDDTHLWAEKYAGKLEDIFEIQETLSRKIVDALKVTLTAEESRGLGERTRHNPRAYECYLRAKQDLWLLSRPALDRALQLIENALGVIGDDPLLYATQAYVISDYAYGVGLDDSYLRIADEAVEKAFTLAPDLRSPRARPPAVHARGSPVGGVRPQEGHGHRPGQPRSHGFADQFDFESYRPVDQEVVVAGDWAFRRAAATWVLKPRAGGPAVNESGKFLIIYRRLPDGSWRIARDIFNRDHPPGAGR